MPGHRPSAGIARYLQAAGGLTRHDPARPETWELEQGVKYMLADPQLNHRPRPHFRGEDNVWA